MVWKQFRGFNQSFGEIILSISQNLTARAFTRRTGSSSPVFAFIYNVSSVNSDVSHSGCPGGSESQKHEQWPGGIGEEFHGTTCFYMSLNGDFSAATMHNIHPKRFCRILPDAQYQLYDNLCNPPQWIPDHSGQKLAIVTVLISPLNIFSGGSLSLWIKTIFIIFLTT